MEPKCLAYINQFNFLLFINESKKNSRIPGTHDKCVISYTEVVYPNFDTSVDPISYHT